MKVAAALHRGPFVAGEGRKDARLVELIGGASNVSPDCTPQLVRVGVSCGVGIVDAVDESNNRVTRRHSRWVRFIGIRSGGVL